MNPFLNCPPIPSATQTQVLTIGSGGANFPATGTLTLSCGVTLGPLNAATLLSDLQRALNVAFPQSVAMGQAGSSGIQGVITVVFFQDPGLAITVSANSLMDAQSPSPQTVGVVISANPGVLYPNYTYLTTRWTEFLLPGTPTPQALQIAETQLMELKKDAWRYVQPRNWGGFSANPKSGGGAFVRATFLMIAHLKKLGRDPVGFVTEQTAKNLSESYSDDKFLAGTVYGQEFIRLRKATIIPMRFIPAGGGVGPTIGYESGGFEGPHNGDYQPIN